MALLESDEVWLKPRWAFDLELRFLTSMTLQIVTSVHRRIWIVPGIGFWHIVGPQQRWTWSFHSLGKAVRPLVGPLELRMPCPQYEMTSHFWNHLRLDGWCVCFVPCWIQFNILIYIWGEGESTCSTLQVKKPQAATFVLNGENNWFWLNYPIFD